MIASHPPLPPLAGAAAPADLDLAGALRNLWTTWVAGPFECAVDTALRNGDLQGLNDATRADIGWRRY